MKFPKMVLSLSVFMLALPGVAMAQDDDGHGLISVRTTTVKPGKAMEYREMLAKLSASRKAAGHSGVAVYQVVRGPASTFYQVTQIDSYSEFDRPFDSGMGEGDWQRWVGNVTDMIDHSIVTTLRTHDEMAIVPDDASPPGLVQLRFTEIAPGMYADQHEWLEEKLVPVLREGGTTSWTVSDVRQGDNVNLWISARRISSWAEMDGPGPIAHLSDRQRDNLFDDYFERLRSSRVEIIRFIPELSY